MKNIKVNTRECPLCHNHREIFVGITASEYLFRKLKKSWLNHAEISAKIIKEMVDKGILEHKSN